MPAQNLKKVFWLFLLLFSLTAIALAIIDLGLQNNSTPLGIVSFEFCVFTSSCEQAVLEWGAKGQALAMLSLGLDYLFLILYPGLICIGLLLLTPRLPQSLHRVTMLVAGLCLVISLADAVENYALIQIILNESANMFGLLAGIFATIKFFCLGAALFWLLFLTVKYVLFSRSKH